MLKCVDCLLFWVCVCVCLCVQTFLWAILLRWGWHRVSGPGEGTHYWQRSGPVIPGPEAWRTDSVTLYSWMSRAQFLNSTFKWWMCILGVEADARKEHLHLKMDEIWSSLIHVGVCLFTHLWPNCCSQNPSKDHFQITPSVFALSVSDIWQYQSGGSTPVLTVKPSDNMSVTLDWQQNNVKDNWTMCDCVF